MTALFSDYVTEPTSGDKIAVKYPMIYKPAATKPCCLHFHGYTGAALEAYAVSGDWWTATDAIARAGYPVLGGDNGGPATFGNSLATTNAGYYLTLARSTSGSAPIAAKATGKYFVSGTSMGGVACMNYARLNAANIAGIILFVPGVDLQYAHDTNPGPPVDADIDAAYTNHAGYLAALSTRSPWVYGTTDLAGIPILCFYKTDDGSTYTPTGASKQSDFLDSMAAVTSVTRYTATGGHNLTGFDLSPLKAWMDAHA